MTRKTRTQEARTESLPQRRVLVLHGPNLNPQQPGRHLRRAAHARRRPHGHGEPGPGRRRAAGILPEQPRGRADRPGPGRRQRGHRVHHHQPGGSHTHTSVALRDALCEVGIPFVEVHLTNIHAGEPFAKHSLLRQGRRVISGLGAQGYQLALEFALARLAPPAPDTTSAAPRPSGRHNIRGNNGPSQAQETDRPGSGIRHFRNWKSPKAKKRCASCTPPARRR